MLAYSACLQVLVRLCIMHWLLHSLGDGLVVDDGSAAGHICKLLTVIPVRIFGSVGLDAIA